MGQVVTWGALGGLYRQDIQQPGSHTPQAWGSAYDIYLQPPASLGAGLVLTASQAFGVNPYPWFYIYDVVASYTALGTGAYSIDIYNALSGGTSYLSAPLTLAAVGANGVGVTSARFSTAPVYKVQSDPLLFGFGVDTIDWYTTNSFARGSVFSLRVSTPAGGSITNLAVSVAGFVSNEASFGLV